MAKPASRDVLIQRLARRFRDRTGAPDIDPEAFADYLLKQGMEPPKIPTVREMMARIARQALKHEIRRDQVTGQPYRGWHAVPAGEDPNTGQRRFSYFDIEDAPRLAMEKAAALKLSGMVNDGAQLARDVAHWNRINPAESPIDVGEKMEGIRDAVEWRLNAPDDEEEEDGEPIDPSSI
jgi:hypothetical protein